MDRHKYLAELKEQLAQKERDLQSLTCLISNIKREIDRETEEIKYVTEANPLCGRYILWSNFRNIISTNKEIWGYKGKGSPKDDKKWCMVPRCSGTSPVVKHEVTTFSHGFWRVCGSCLNTRRNDCMMLFDEKNIANDEKVLIDPNIYPDPKVRKMLGTYLL